MSDEEDSEVHRRGGEPSILELNGILKDLGHRVQATRYPDLIIPKSDITFLTKFLRTKDYKIDAAEEGIRKYYNYIHRNLEFFEECRPSQFRDAIDSGVVSVMKQDFNGTRLLLVQAKKWKPKKVDLRSLQLLTVFLIENYVKLKEVQENGCMLIFDMEGLSMEQAWKLSVKELRRILQAGFEGIPLRIAGLHFINVPTIFWPIYKILMKFAKEKMKKRFHCHENLESLHEQLGKHLLPDCLGGDLKDEEAVDTEFLNRILKADIPYEEYWNGGLGKPRMDRRLSRKRSSIDMTGLSLVR